MKKDVPTVWGTFGISEGLKVAGTVQYTQLKDGAVIGSQFNFGVGLPFGDAPVNEAIGVSNTYLLYDFGGVLKDH